MSSLLAGALIVGCGGDDNAVIGNPDASADGSVDGPLRDRNVADTSEFDVNQPDTSTDAGLDAPYDSAALLAFPAQQAEAACARIATCCLGNDAAAFDTATCISSFYAGQPFAGGSWQGSLSDLVATDGGLQPIMKRGKLRLDPNAAASCESLATSFQCPTLSSAQNATLTQDCYGAVFGTVGIGQSGCISSAECVRGAYCASNPDGGEGSCAALKADGGDCRGAQFYDVCIYRGADGLQHCDSEADNDGGDGGGRTFTCAPNFATGHPCNFDRECASEICDLTNSVCAVSRVFPDSITCAFLKN